MAVIYTMMFIVFLLVIIGFILFCKFLPDVQNPFKKQMKGKKDVSLNVVEAPPRRIVVPPVEKKTLKDAWNVISQEAKKEIPQMEVEVARPLKPMPVQKPINPLEPKPVKPAKKKLSKAELEKRKIDTRPGKWKNTQY